MFGKIGKAISSPAASDALFLLGATLKDISDGGSDNLMGAQQMVAQRGQKAAEQEWQKGLLTRLGLGPAGGGIASLPPAEGGAALAGADGKPGESAGLGAGGMKLGADVLPYLLAGAMGGYKGVGDAVSIIDKFRPDIDFVNGVAVDKRGAKPGDRVGVNLSNVNGFAVDMQDPKNAGRYYGEPPTKGARPTFDQDGKHIGWQMMDGSLQAIRDAAAAEAGGRVDETLYNVPTESGASLYMRGRDYAGPGAEGIGRTQTPGARIEQEGTARTAVDRAALAPRARSALNAQARTTDIVLGKIDEALGQINNLTAGPMSLTAGVPGSPAKNLAATLDTIRGNVGLDKLNEMRANSPTGGALGNVTERENAILQSVLGSIDQGQSQGQLRRNLEAIKKELTAAREARQAAYETQYGAGARAAAPPVASASQGRGYSVVGVRRSQ